MSDTRTPIPLHEPRNVMGVVLVVLATMFFIALGLYHILVILLGGTQRFYGFDFMMPLYVSALNFLLFGIVLGKGILDERPRLHYRNFCFLVFGLSTIALGMIVFSDVLPLNRFAGLRQEAFFVKFGLLTVSFLLAFPSAFWVWKKMPDLPPQLPNPPETLAQQRHPTDKKESTKTSDRKGLLRRQGATIPNLIFGVGVFFLCCWPMVATGGITVGRFELGATLWAIVILPCFLFSLLLVRASCSRQWKIVTPLIVALIVPFIRTIQFSISPLPGSIKGELWAYCLSVGLLFAFHQYLLPQRVKITDAKEHPLSTDPSPPA